MKPFLKLTSLFTLALFSQLSLADIQLETVAEIEVTDTSPQGEIVTLRKPASNVVPGTEVIYTITAHNTGAEDASSIVITNPVPEHTVYIKGSAFGSGTDISFSVDGGNSFNKPEKLTIKDAKGNTRPATAEDYTHIRWVLQFALKPGQKAPVWYRVRIK